MKKQKLSKDFIGKCELQQLPEGTMFMVLKRGTLLCYRKGSFDSKTDKYNCLKYGYNKVQLSGNTIVSTEYVYKIREYVSNLINNFMGNYDSCKEQI